MNFWQKHATEAKKRLNEFLRGEAWHIIIIRALTIIKVFLGRTLKSEFGRTEQFGSVQ